MHTKTVYDVRVWTCNLREAKSQASDCCKWFKAVLLPSLGMMQLSEKIPSMIVSDSSVSRYATFLLFTVMFF